jgi:creatinase
VALPEARLLTFAPEEYEDRQEGLREAMDLHGLDAVVLTSARNMTYYAGQAPAGTGGPAGGLVVTRGGSVLITGPQSGARGRRRGHGEVLVCDGARRDAFWRAAARVAGTGKAIGCEADHLTLMQSELLNAHLKPKRGVDVALAAMQQRMVKSEAELDLLRRLAAIAGLGLAEMRGASEDGARECDIAWAGRAAMEREILRVFPDAEAQGSLALAQSGPNSDGLAAPVTARRLKRGDVLGLTAAPMLGGYGAALKRTLVLAGAAGAAAVHLDGLAAFHREAAALVRPGAGCGQIAEAMGALAAGHGLPVQLGGGLPGEPLLALDPGNETVLEAGMVVALAPMLVVPQGKPGAGGYGLQDLFAVTETGAERLGGAAPGVGG